MYNYYVYTFKIRYEDSYSIVSLYEPVKQILNS